MFKDEKTGKEFAGTQNPWIKRLGLVLLIIGMTTPFWKERPTLLAGVLLFFIVSAIIWGIIRYIIVGIKNLVK